MWDDGWKVIVRHDPDLPLRRGACGGLGADLAGTRVGVADRSHNWVSARCVRTVRSSASRPSRIQIRSVRVVGPEFTPPYVLVLPSVP